MHLACFTQEEIAAAMGMSQDAVSRVVREMATFRFCVKPDFLRAEVNRRKLPEGEWAEFTATATARAWGFLGRAEMDRWWNEERREPNDDDLKRASYFPESDVLGPPTKPATTAAKP